MSTQMVDHHDNNDSNEEIEPNEENKHEDDHTDQSESYCDYNLLFDEDVSLLGNGFHTGTTTTDSRFDTHPRLSIYFVITASLLTVNFLFLAQISIVVIDIFIHSAVLLVAGFLEYQQRHSLKIKDDYLPRSSPQIGSYLTDEQSDELNRMSLDDLKSKQSNNIFIHSYTNRMNWIYQIPNTYGTLPQWTSWALPLIMLYYEIMLLIILNVWGTDTAPGQYCKTSYPDDSDPDFETGGCFLQKEVALLFGLGSLAGIIASLGSLYDISPKGMKSVELAKKQIIRLFANRNYNPFVDDYFVQIDSERERLVKSLRDKKTQFIVVIGIIFLWSIHVLYWELKLISRVQVNFNAVIVLYVLNVIGFAFTSYIIVESMHTIKNLYKHYWVIMQTLARPLRIKRIMDIKAWTEIRKFYMNYHMVMYFNCANGVVASYVVIEVVCVLIGIYWKFVTGLHILSAPTFVVAVGGVVFTCNLLHILALCADISNSKTIHIAMLQQEKERMLWMIRNPNEIVNDTEVDQIDHICEHIAENDKSPKILGLGMTWRLYNIMLVYGLGGALSLLLDTIFVG